MELIHFCPYCQSNNIETVYKGNYIQTEIIICKACGRTIYDEKEADITGATDTAPAKENTEAEIRQLLKDMDEDPLHQYLSQNIGNSKE